MSAYNQSTEHIVIYWHTIIWMFDFERDFYCPIMEKHLIFYSSLVIQLDLTRQLRWDKIWVSSAKTRANERESFHQGDPK